VDVVAFLPPRLLSHLRVVLRSGHTLTPVASWSELGVVVQHQRADVIVADPGASSELGTDALEDIRRRFASLPVVLYIQLAPNTVQAVMRLAKVGVQHVVLSRFDDEPVRFLELLEGLPARGLSERMLESLSGALSSLPAPVVRGIEQLYRSPDRFKNAQDLAAAAGVTLRTLYRSLESAGIFSARTLVVSAKLLRAFGLLQDPGRSIKDVAANAGYHSPWQLSQQFRALTGQTTNRVRRGMTGETLVDLLSEQALRGRGRS
jgi:AraC-like DNA-binding protein